MLNHQDVRRVIRLADKTDHASDQDCRQCNADGDHANLHRSRSADQFGEDQSAKIEPENLFLTAVR